MASHQLQAMGEFCFVTEYGSLHQELQKRYEMALELLGERNEYVDKLEDDIREMKSIFHTQLSLMADQLSMAKQDGSAVVK